jgi:hypothetical protein
MLPQTNLHKKKNSSRVNLTVWDDSVREVFKDVHRIDRRPPTNFPAQVTIRFDIQSEATEPLMTQ